MIVNKYLPNDIFSIKTNNGKSLLFDNGLSYKVNLGDFRYLQTAKKLPFDFQKNTSRNVKYYLIDLCLL